MWGWILLLYLIVVIKLFNNKKNRIITSIIFITLILINMLLTQREPHLFDYLAIIIIFIVCRSMKSEDKAVGFFFALTSIYWIYPLV